MKAERRNTIEIAVRVKRIRAELANGNLEIDSRKLAHAILTKELEEVITTRRKRRPTVQQWGERPVAKA